MEVLDQGGGVWGAQVRSPKAIKEMVRGSRESESSSRREESVQCLPHLYSQKSEFPPFFEGFLEYKLQPRLNYCSANPHKDHILKPGKTE